MRTIEHYNRDNIVSEIISKIDKIDSDIWNDPDLEIEVEIVYDE
jgi:hypothetical protein